MQNPGFTGEAANLKPRFAVILPMVRPTFLIAEPRPHEGISARKLVLETALYNVITAYDGPEALELLEKFPNVDAMIVHAGFGEKMYNEVIQASKKSDPERMIILLSPNRVTKHDSVDFHLSSHDPKQLLDLLLDRFKLPEMV